MSCNRSLIVCATQRSGSSFLSESLALIGIGEPNEWLKLESFDYAKKEAGFPPDASFKQTLEYIISKREQNGIFSVKIMWDNLQMLLSQLALEDPSKKTYSIDQWLHELFPAPHLIYINRKNTLKQAISLAKARQSDVWSYTEEWLQEKATQAELRFNFGMIRKQLNFLHHQKQKWASFLDQTTLPLLSLDFESFKQDYSGTLFQIAQFWNSPLPHVIPEPHLNKPMSDQTNQDWFQEYQDLFQSARSHYSPSRCAPLAQNDQVGKIQSIKTSLKSHRSEFGFIQFIITNQSSSIWPNIAQDNLTGSVILDGQVKDLQNNQICSKSRTFLPADLNPGESTTVELALTAPSSFGHYTIEAELVQIGFGPFSSLDRPFAQIDLEVIPTFEESQSTLLFPLSKPTTWGWVHDPIFGYLNTLKYPIIFHHDLGRLHFFGNDPLNLWFFHSSLGLLYTTPSDYPYLYSNRLQAWIELNSNDSKTHFTRLDDGTPVDPSTSANES